MSRGTTLAAVAAAVLTLAALTVVALRPIAMAPGGDAWARIVRGPTADGILYPGAKAVIALPDLARSRPRDMVIDGLSLGDTPAVLSVSVDGAAPVMVALDARRAATLTIPPASHSGMRLDVATERGAPARLRAVTVGGAWPSAMVVLVVVFLAGLATAGASTIEALDARGAIALAPVGAAAALLVFAFTTGALSLGWSGLVIGGAAVLVAAGILAGARGPRASRAARARAALLVAAVAFGAGARWVFAPSTGSWDMEYWRAFPIDYPPLALAAWQAAAAVVPARDASSWNVALKLPALAGDLLAVAILLFWWPARRAGARAAALYWALPASWLSSATLGYLDGAYAPFVLAAAVAAGLGRAGPAGAALAVAALLKPTALVAAPAIAVALRTPRRIVAAVAAGLAVVAVVLVPLARAGTVGTAIAHVLPILYQERLSGGYANVWWLLGAVVSGDAASVPYVRIDAVPFPARAAGVVAFAGAAFVIGRALARARGTAATLAASAALFAAYGVLGVGVHVNHPHPLVLLFLAAGITAAAWRWPAWLFIHGYALNILLLEQLGRLAGPRYGALERAGGIIEKIRYGGGLDLTVALAVAHIAALTVLIVRASPALRAVSAHASQVDDQPAVL